MRALLAGTAAGAVLSAGLVTGVAAADAGAAAPHAVPACHNAALRVGHNHPQGATGHGNVIIRFRNISHATCSLRGYPGLDALGPHGGVLAHATRTPHGFTGGAHSVKTIVLHPNGLASADVEWMNFGPGGRSCRFSAAIATTPANTTKTVRFPISVSVCSLEVHPTVAGGSGNG